MSELLNGGENQPRFFPPFVLGFRREDEHARLRHLDLRTCNRARDSSARSCLPDVPSLSDFLLLYLVRICEFGEFVACLRKEPRALPPAVLV